MRRPYVSDHASPGVRVRGFTIVELLVVIAIIAVLMGLVVPAVQAAREAARRSRCFNRLEQIGLALHAHECAFGFMPAWQKWVPEPSNPGNPLYRRLADAQFTFGALGHLLPFLEAGGIHDRFDVRRPLLDPVNLPPPWPGGLNDPAALADIQTFLCPSSPATRAESDYGPYFARFGLISGAFRLPRTDYAPLKGVHGSLRACAGLPPTDTNNAMLGTADSRIRSTVRVCEVTDGLSKTLCFTEIAGKQGIWFQGRNLAQPPATIYVSSYYGDWNIARHPRGLSGTNPANPLEAGCSIINVSNKDNPYGFHPRGVATVRGDGSVVFLSEDVSPSVFVALVGRDDGGAVRLD